MAKGFHQQEGYGYHETFNLVIKPVTVRVMLNVALSRNWPVQQLDFNNAFLDGDLKEQVFMTQPEGFQVRGAYLVCRLNKALYGLKQAP